MERATHIWIPDTQIKPGVPLIHLEWAGRFIVEKAKHWPNVKVIVGGDWYDFPSLSHYDKGKLQFERRRFMKDLMAGHEGLDIFWKPIDDYNAMRRRNKDKMFHIEKHYLLGNHEHRADRVASDFPELDGFIGTHLCREYWEERGWTTYEFLDVVDIDGVWYSHYFPAEHTGRPLGGMCQTVLKNVGHSFTQGHRQVHDPANRQVGAKRHRGLISGAFYLHDEDYRGPLRSRSIRTGNHHWRGIVVKHDVKDGDYDLREVSVEALCRMFTGMELHDFMRREGYPID